MITLRLAKIRRDIELERLGQFGHFGFGAAHFQFRIVFVNLFANLREFAGGMFDFSHVVFVGLFVHG